MVFELTVEQKTLVELPFDTTISLGGPAGSGKTTAAIARMLRILGQQTIENQFLILAPNRLLLSKYDQAIRKNLKSFGEHPTLVTFGGLAQRFVRLFWPLAVNSAGFCSPMKPPLFLTLETAQYCMAHIVRPLMDENHLFESVVMDRNRLYSQLLDNLNKSAAIGFPYQEISDRLKRAWVGLPGQLRVYDDVQTCVNLFRNFCLENNLLDFSLQIEVFQKHLWPNSEVRHYFEKKYKHLIYDNSEEDIPAAHDLIRECLPSFKSALIISDDNAGYRMFLGADPKSAENLQSLCERKLRYNRTLVQSPMIISLEELLTNQFNRSGILVSQSDQVPSNSSQEQARVQSDRNLTKEAFHIQSSIYYPEMIDWVAQTIKHLVETSGVLPSEIVVLAPYMTDSLRFSLGERLTKYQIPFRSHRPSRALREEPATGCLLTLAALGNPAWQVRPSRFDVVYALMKAIAGFDLVRAQLLTDIVYHPKTEGNWLTGFDRIQPRMQARIGYIFGERFERIRKWLEEASIEPVELDHFLSRLFGELLSQPGFGFHTNFDDGYTVSRLIESVQKFRGIAKPFLDEIGVPVGKEYYQMVQDGVIAAEYLGSWGQDDANAVLLAPAYTFLLENRPVEIQFWLDAGSRSWSERLQQPLTQPYVLSRNWPVGQAWSDVEESTASRKATMRLVAGLLKRCRKAIYLGFTQYGEQGYEQRGPLLSIFQDILRAQISRSGNA